jgi:hypothetical protein
MYADVIIITATFIGIVVVIIIIEITLVFPQTPARLVQRIDCLHPNSLSLLLLEEKIHQTRRTVSCNEIWSDTTKGKNNPGGKISPRFKICEMKI